MARRLDQIRAAKSEIRKANREKTRAEAAEAEKTRAEAAEAAERLEEERREEGRMAKLKGKLKKDRRSGGVSWDNECNK